MSSVKGKALTREFCDIAGDSRCVFHYHHGEDCFDVLLIAKTKGDRKR